MLVGQRTEQTRAQFQGAPNKSRRFMVGIALGVIVTALAAVAAAGVLRPEIAGGNGRLSDGPLPGPMVVYDAERQQINVLVGIGNRGRRPFRLADISVPAALGSLEAFEATPEQGRVTTYQYPGANPIEPPVAVDLQPGDSAVLYLWFEPENCLDALARAVDIELQLELSSGLSLGGRSLPIRDLAPSSVSQYRFHIDELGTTAGETPCESYDKARAGQ